MNQGAEAVASSEINIPPITCAVEAAEIVETAKAEQKRA